MSADPMPSGQEALDVLTPQQWPPPTDTCWRDPDGWTWWHDGHSWCLTYSTGSMRISHADPTAHPQHNFPMTRTTREESRR